MPDLEEAYHCPQQYTFGSELIAAPFTAPADPETRLSRQVVWLPPGDWYHFFTGEYFAGNGWYAIYGRLDDIPVFARAGAIVPLAAKVGWGGVDNPAELDLHVFAGAGNRFILYEDDGESLAYLDGHYALTEYEQVWQGNEMAVRIAAASGDLDQIPAQRRYRIHCHGVRFPERVTLQIDNEEVAYRFTYDAASETVHFAAIELAATAGLALTLSVDGDSLLARRDRTQETCYAMLEAFKLETSAKAALARQLDELQSNPALLAVYAINLTESQVRALLEVTLQAGVHHLRHMREEDLLLLWNNREDTGMTYQFSLWHEATGHGQRFNAETGVVPRFRALVPIPRAIVTSPDGRLLSRSRWRLTTNYASLVSVIHKN